MTNPPLCFPSLLSSHTLLQTSHTLSANPSLTSASLCLRLSTGSLTVSITDMRAPVVGGSGGVYALCSAHLANVVMVTLIIIIIIIASIVKSQSLLFGGGGFPSKRMKNKHRVTPRRLTLQTRSCTVLHIRRVPNRILLY